MNNRKLLVTVGISGSGKSTWAHQQWLKDPLNTVIINRDKIRELIFGYTEESIKDYYNKGGLHLLEDKVTIYEDLIITESIRRDNTVIVDATNLSMKSINRFKDSGIDCTFYWFDIPLEEAIERDAKRNRTVGAEVITKQHERYVNFKKEYESKNINNISKGDN